MMELRTGIGCAPIYPEAISYMLNAGHVCRFYSGGCIPEKEIVQATGPAYAYATPHAVAYECSRVVDKEARGVAAVNEEIPPKIGLVVVQGA